MELKLMPLTRYGQIHTGDQIAFCDASGSVTCGPVVKVNFFGTPEEEVIVDKRFNRYFLTANYMAGDSWVKDCRIVRAAEKE